MCRMDAHLQAVHVPAGVAAVAQDDALALLAAAAGIAHDVLVRGGPVRGLCGRPPGASAGGALLRGATLIL